MFSSAITVIVTKDTDGDLWDSKNLGADFSDKPFGFQVTLLSMFFTYYTMSQPLQDTLRSKQTTAEEAYRFDFALDGEGI